MPARGAQAAGGSGARAARAACERPPRGRDLGAGARSPRERRAPQGVGAGGGAQRRGPHSDLMLEPSTSRAAPRGLTPRSPVAPWFTPVPAPETVGEGEEATPSLEGRVPFVCASWRDPCLEQRWPRYPARRLLTLEGETLQGRDPIHAQQILLGPVS